MGLPAALRRRRARRPARAPVRGRPLGGAAAARPRGRPRRERCPTRRCCCSASPVPSCSPPARHGHRRGAARAAQRRPRAAGCWPPAAASRSLSGRRSRRGGRQPALPRAAGRAHGRARRAAELCRPPCTRCWPPVSTCSPPRERSLLDAAAIEGERFHLGGVARPRRGRPATASQGAASTRSSTASCSCRHRPRSPASRRGASATRSCETPPTRRCPRPPARRGTSALPGGSPPDRVPRARGRRADRHRTSTAPTARLVRARARAAEPERSPPRPRSASPRPVATRTAAATCRARSRSCLARRRAARRTMTSRARELLAALAVAQFETGTMERAGEAAEAALALGERLGLARVRQRAAIERQRVRAFRHPAAVDPGTALAVARDAMAALADLGDDLGLARAYIVESELVWLKGGVDASYRSAERAVHHARRARSGFEIDSGVSLHGVRAHRQRGPGVGGHPRAARNLSARSTGRFAALSVRGFRAVLEAGAMAGTFRSRTRESSCERARRPGGTGVSGQLPRCGWRCSTRMAEMLAGDAACRRARATTTLSGSRSTSATAGFTRRSWSIARTPSSAQGGPRRRRPRPSHASTMSQRPATWSG